MKVANGAQNGAQNGGWTWGAKLLLLVVLVIAGFMAW